jgi:hypothetical protein
MPTAITLTPRLLYKEDIAFTTNPSGETASVTVLGAPTNPNTLNKVPAVLLTMFTQAANDAAAAAAGVNVGQIYYHTGEGGLHTRMT